MAVWTSGDAVRLARGTGQTSFIGDVFDGVSLHATNMTGCNLSNASCVGTDFSNGDLSFANLAGAVLTGANLQDTLLLGAAITGAQLASATINAGTRYDQALGDPGNWFTSASGE